MPTQWVPGEERFETYQERYTRETSPPFHDFDVSGVCKRCGFMAGSAMRQRCPYYEEEE